MKQQWANLNDRERWTLGVGGVVFCLYLLYLLLFAPLIRSVDGKSQQLAEKQATLAWMQQVRLQHHNVKAAEVLSSSKLLTVLAHELEATSLHGFPYPLEQTGTGDIQLSFDEVPYHSVLTWLGSIVKKYQFSIKQLNAEQNKTPGVVKLLLIIH